MSSLPHPEGVEEVIGLLEEVDELSSESLVLRRYATRLAEVEKRLGELRSKLPGMLRRMDVESPGNAGWESRMGWFLTEMRRQIVERAEKELRRRSENL